ncbi:MAG: hypothetical protein MUC41_19100 [Syntrophobacteraceae bacterium]|nr:hypothetical protein [Syntrophobacteraceae bacterium]
MAEEKGKKVINYRDVTICDSTMQMLQKMADDGVENAFTRAAEMKACPIGADSACCKHCFMGPGWWRRAVLRTRTTAWGSWMFSVAW